ncbi:MAG: WD40 repeat domain-containing protein, partial [Aggregatilineales bacterium]
TGETVIYNEAGEVQTRLTIHPDYNRAVDFDAENDWLAAGGMDGTVKVWTLPERTSEITIEAHDSPITQVAFSSDGAYLATADENGVIRIWEWATREQRAEYSTIGQIVEMTFSPDDTQLAVATEFDVSLWDIETASLFRTLAIEAGGASSIFTYSPDGRFFFTAGAEADMAVWNPIDGSIVAQIPDVSDNRLSVTFSPESDLMITTTLDRNVSLWNLREVNLEEQQISRATLNLETRRIVRGAWSPDGYALVFFDTDGRAYVWGIAEDTDTAAP